MLNRSFASRQWFDAACQTANIRPNVRLESSAPNAVLGLAEAGYGIAILPSMVRFPRRGVRPVPSRQSPRLDRQVDQAGMGPPALLGARCGDLSGGPGRSCPARLIRAVL